MHVSQHIPAIPASRAARQADLPAIERLLAICGLESTGIAELLAEGPEDVIVLEHEARPGELAAVAALEVVGDDALLRSVAVHPDWRRRRLGEAIVRAVIDQAARRRLRALYLLTTTAEHFFPKYGFVRVDRASVPAAIAATHEFRIMCPASAVVMFAALES